MPGFGGQLFRAYGSSGRIRTVAMLRMAREEAVRDTFARRRGFYTPRFPSILLPASVSPFVLSSHRFDPNQNGRRKRHFPNNRRTEAL
jgi:hypothetical protein